MQQLNQIDDDLLKKAFNKFLSNKKTAKLFLKSVMSEIKRSSMSNTYEGNLISKHVIFATTQDAYYKEITASMLAKEIQGYYKEDLRLSPVKLGRELSKLCILPKLYKHGVAIYPIKEIKK